MLGNWSERRAIDTGRWVISAMAALIMTVVIFSTSPVAVGAQDSTRGKDLFERRCGGCHALDNDKEGPRLRSVFGRPSGSISSFKYSDGFKNAHITWNAESLEKWLTDPDKVIPDNDMAFHVEKADERRDIIAYLKELAGK
jgi:cytochrome c